MNKKITLTMGVCLLLILLFQPSLLFSQTQLSVDRQDAIYQVGETARFQVRSSSGGTANYKIYYGERSEAIESGTINLSANQTQTITYRHTKPGVVLCSVSGAGGSDIVAATFSPFSIVSLESEPSDFDSYWNNKKNQVSQLSSSPQLAVFKNNANSTTYTLSLPNLDGRRIYGYLTIPKGSGPFPAAIILPAFGASAGSVTPEIPVAETGGLITASLSVHNVAVNQQDPNAYKPDNTDNRDQIYYKYALAGAMNVINYLQTRPDFDKRNICAMGVSQGGGLAMLLAGIDNRVNLLVNSNPAMNEHQGHKYQQAGGFPYYLNDAVLSTGGQSKYNAVSSAVKYYDAVYANKRFKGKSYNLIGLEDNVVPSATSLAGFNQLRGEKILILSKDSGHGHPGEYWNGRYDFLRRHYQLNPPFQFAATTKGYSVDAGDNTQASTSAAISLNGRVQLEAQTVSNLSTQWTKISGPGNVNFSNDRSANTTVSFTQAGTYTLQFLAQDNRKLNSNGQIYFLADDITVTVGNGGNTTGGGTTGGTTTGGGTTGTTTGGGTTGGNSNGSLTISCPTNINLTAAAGQSTAVARWNNPTVNSTCAQSTSNCSTTISGYRFLGRVGQSNFFLSNDDFSWKEAETDARQRGGYMASIDNQQVNDLIQSTGDIVYIGLTDEVQEGVFRWVDGSPVSYTNYQSDVSNTNNLDYMALNPWDGSWAYYDNMVAKKYVLEVPCTGSDATPSLTQTGGLSSGSNFPIGTSVISYQASDACGNVKTCSFSVTVQATTTSLSLSCPNTRNVQLNAGFSQKQVSWNNPTPVTNCPGDIVLNQLGGPSNNSFIGAGSYVVSYEATDRCSNRGTCSFRIDVQEAPATNLTLTCSRDLNFQIAAGQSQRTVTWETPQRSSDCSAVELTQISGPAPGSSLSAGTYQISYEATDDCGNSQTCSFNITLNSTTPPPTTTNIVIDCPEDRTIAVNSSENGAIVSWSDPQASSTCATGSATTNCTQTISGFRYIGENNGSNYFISDTKGNWDIAINAAASTGGHLVKINSAEENSYLQQLLQGGYYLIGLSDEAAEDSFVWTDGSVAAYQNFEENYSNSIYNNFALFNGWEGTWRLTGNSVHLDYILEVPCSNQQSSTVTVQSGGPRNGGLLPVGTSIIEYLATDACGNFTTCSFAITVKRENATTTTDCSDTREGGSISTSENSCTSFQATIIAELFTPIGVGEDYEYVWLSSTTSCPTSIEQQITGADKEFYDPGFLTQTTYFTRWLRKKGCTEWKASSCVVKQIEACSDRNGGAEGPGGPSGGGGAEDATGSCIIQAQSINLSNGKTIGGDINNIIDGTGLSEESPTSTHTTGKLYDGVWLNDGISPVLEFELGTAQTIDGVALWNYAYHNWMVLKRRGVMDFAISTSMNGSDYGTESTFTARITTASGMPEAAQFFSLPNPVTARSVKLRIINAQDDASYVGLGEVRFTNNCGVRGLEEETTVHSKISTLNTSTKSISDWSVSPNPSNGLFFIDLPSKAEQLIQVQVFDEIGKIVYQKEHTAQQSIHLDLQQFSAGLYLIKIQDGKTDFKLKKIVIH